MSASLRQLGQQRVEALAIANLQSDLEVSLHLLRVRPVSPRQVVVPHRVLLAGVASRNLGQGLGI